MNIADYILFIFIAAMILFGIYKGFVGMIVDLLSNIVSFIAAVFFAKALTGAIQNFPIFDGMKKAIQEFFTNNADLASKNVTQTVDGIALPQFIKDFILKDFPNSGESVNIGAQSLAERVFYLMLLAIVCLVIFIIVRVAFYFVETVIMKIFKKVKILDAVNKILGAVLGVADAVLILYVVLAIITLLSTRIPSITSVVSDSAIVSKFYFNNLLLMILT